MSNQFGLTAIAQCGALPVQAARWWVTINILGLRMSSAHDEWKPLRFFLGIDNQPCPRRISSMFAIAVACLLFVAQLSDSFSSLLSLGTIIPLLVFGFSQEARFVAERARQTPSFGGKPGILTDHHGHPSTLRVKFLCCNISAIFVILTDSFSRSEGESSSISFGLFLCFFLIPLLAKGLLGIIERPGPPPPVNASA